MAINNDNESFNCFMCQIVGDFETNSSLLIDDLSAAMLPPMWLMFMAISGVWIVWEGIKIGTFRTTFGQSAQEFFFVCIAAMLLASQAPIQLALHTSLLLLGGASAFVFETILQIAPTAGADEAMQYEGLQRLVAVATKGFTDVAELSATIINSGAISDPSPWGWGIVLVLPYFLLLIIYSGQVVVAIARLTVISAFFPFLMVCLGFQWSRNMTASGMKTMLSAIIVLFSATIALGVVMFSVSNLGITEAMPDEEIRNMADLSNPKFLLAVALGWIGSALMTDAVGQANSITGSAFSNTAVGVMTAGATGTAMWAAKKGMGPAAFIVDGIKSFAKGPNDAVQNASDQVRDRYYGKSPKK